jgi:hypothetical protein
MADIVNATGAATAQQINDGGPAFPQAEYPHMGQSGMTLRDYFAAKALMGLLASRNGSSPRFHPKDDAEYVYAVADAMLAARAAIPQPAATEAPCLNCGRIECIGECHQEDSL